MENVRSGGLPVDTCVNFRNLGPSCCMGRIFNKKCRGHCGHSAILLYPLKKQQNKSHLLSTLFVPKFGKCPGILSISTIYILIITCGPGNSSRPLSLLKLLSHLHDMITISLTEDIVITPGVMWENAKYGYTGQSTEQIGLVLVVRSKPDSVMFRWVIVL